MWVNHIEMYFKYHDIKNKQMMFQNQIFEFGPMDGSQPDSMLINYSNIKTDNFFGFFL